jgi:ribosome-associated protein
MPEHNDKPELDQPKQNQGLADEEDLGPSKSAVKRALAALQDMGAELVQLSDRELARMPIEDEALAHAIAEARRIRSNSARKRQLQYIGKLMRKIDAEPLKRALGELHQQRRQHTDAFHQLEILRDTLLAEGPDAIAEVLEIYPDADRQHLRQLLRQHQKEVSTNKPPRTARKLFQYLRELSA